MIEVSTLPEAEWETAARKIILQEFSADATVRTISGYEGSFTCVEADVSARDQKAVMCCLNSTLGLASTFLGDPSLKQAYVGVLASANRAH